MFTHAPGPRINLDRAFPCSFACKKASAGLERRVNHGILTRPQRQCKIVKISLSTFPPAHHEWFPKMKKCCIITRPRLLALTCALILIGALIVLRFARTQPYDRSQADLLYQERAAELPVRGEITLRWLPEDQIAAVTESLTLVNTTESDWPDIALRTYAGAYALEETSPAALDEFYDEDYPDDFAYGDIELEGVWADGAITNAGFSDEARTVLRISHPLRVGEIVHLTLRCRLFIPVSRHRLGISDNAVRLLHMLPTPCVFENGAWQAPAYATFGEPFYAPFGSYLIHVEAPEGWQAVCSAQGPSSAPSLVLLNGYAVRTGTASGIPISVYARDAADAGKLLRAASDIVNRLTTALGDLPTNTLSLCALPYFTEAESVTGLVLVRDDLTQGDAWESDLAFALAGQWFGGVTGVDGFHDAWLNEASRQWAALRYVGLASGSAARETLIESEIDAAMRENLHAAVTAGSPADFFPSANVYRAAVRARGCAFLIAADTLSQGRLDAFLREELARYPFENLSRTQWAEDFNAFTGTDIAPLMLDYLDTYINE